MRLKWSSAMAVEKAHWLYKTAWSGLADVTVPLVVTLRMQLALASHYEMRRDTFLNATTRETPSA